jgi:hypothetical protein
LVCETIGFDSIGSTQIFAPHDFVNVLKFLHRSTPPTPDMIRQAEEQVRRAPPQSSYSAASEYGMGMMNNLHRRMKSGSEDGIAKMRAMTGMEADEEELQTRDRSPVKEEGRRRRSPPMDENAARRRARERPSADERPVRNGGGERRSPQRSGGRAPSPQRSARPGSSRDVSGRSPTRPTERQRPQGGERYHGGERESEGRVRHLPDAPRQERSPRHRQQQGSMEAQMGGMSVRRTDPKGEAGPSTEMKSGKKEGKGWFGRK